MNRQTAPRIYCIPALDAPVVAVFRRGPSDWCHVGRWDLERKVYEPGAWLRARLFPRRSDVSPDGKYLCYFAHDPTATWEHGDAYVAVSRLPWLTALYAVGTCGTWTRGYYLDADKRGGAIGIDELPVRFPYGLHGYPSIQFACERHRGWEETADCAPRQPKDMWDLNRNARLQKRQPGGKAMLYVESVGVPGGAFESGQAVDGMHVRYSIGRKDDIFPLDDLQWADWDRQGRLLVATRCGKLQVRMPEAEPAEILFEADLAPLQPDPAPAPEEARRW